MKTIKFQTSSPSAESNPKTYNINLKFLDSRSPYIASDSSFDSSTEDRDREPALTKSISGLTSSSAVTSQSEATTVIAKESPASEAFPESQIPSPVNEDNIPRSDAPSPDELLPVPQTVCVVDGLYSVRSPKGHKVLVGVELSPRVSEPVRTTPHQIAHTECDEVLTTVVDVDLITTQIIRTYSFEADNVECTCASPVDLLNVLSASSEERELLPSASSEEREFLNARSVVGSSSEELKSGTTSPFYSPSTDSPDMTIANSAKMDKEVWFLRVFWGFYEIFCFSLRLISFWRNIGALRERWKFLGSLIRALGSASSAGRSICIIRDRIAILRFLGFL